MDIHDIDNEYNALPMTAFWDRPYRTIGGGDVLCSGLKPKAPIINNTMLTAEIASSVWLVALSNLTGYRRQIFCHFWNSAPILDCIKSY